MISAGVPANVSQKVLLFLIASAANSGCTAFGASPYQTISAHSAPVPPESAFTYGLINNCEKGASVGPVGSDGPA